MYENNIDFKNQFYTKLDKNRTQRFAFECVCMCVSVVVVVGGLGVGVIVAKDVKTVLLNN
jgi:hypothetical protein